MTDRDLLEKKLAFIETCIGDLHRLARPEQIETDVREERFVAHTLQLAIQSALDAASHIVSERRLGEPESNHQLFQLLNTEIGLSETLLLSLRNMAGFRNLLVHGYQTVDRAILRNVVENNLDDLQAFVDGVRGRFLD
ncbi:MAG: type VII toxin-antitoxin system HepT family RNase toxin [Pseudomonadota bacterium]